MRKRRYLSLKLSFESVIVTDRMRDSSVWVDWVKEGRQRGNMEFEAIAMVSVTTVTIRNDRKAAKAKFGMIGRRQKPRVQIKKWRTPHVGSTYYGFSGGCINKMYGKTRIFIYPPDALYILMIC
jgi:hypothetical protein